MPILGAVLSLTSEPGPLAEALDFLRQHPRIELGEPQELGLPVVIDSQSSGQEKEIWDALRSQAGVLFAKVVYHDFSDLVEREDAP
jgi:nitrate reductase NapAB chaperone NapD